MFEIFVAFVVLLKNPIKFSIKWKKNNQKTSSKCLPCNHLRLKFFCFILIMYIYIYICKTIENNYCLI